MGRAGTGAPPLQNHRFLENETALPLAQLKKATENTQVFRFPQPPDPP